MVTHVFGTSWSAISTNLQGAFITAPIGKTVNDFKRGAITGNATGIGSLAGREVVAKLNAVKRHFLPNDKALNTSSSNVVVGGVGAQSSHYLKRQGLSGFSMPQPIGTSTSIASVQTAPTQIASGNSSKEAVQTIQVKQQGHSDDELERGSDAHPQPIPYRPLHLAQIGGEA